MDSAALTVVRRPGAIDLVSMVVAQQGGARSLEPKLLAGSSDEGAMPFSLDRLAISIVHGLLVVAAAVSGAGPGRAAPAPNAPVAVTSSLTIRNGNWIPLPVADMKRAAGDAALARLTDAGRLELVASGGEPETGRLALEIALIGPAETAKLTIQLDAPSSPSLVSTASISVRGLDHAGIYAALEHVGGRAADRLVAKIDLLRVVEAAGPTGDSARSILDDPERKRLFDVAQSAKRADRYAEARAGFESVVASADDAHDPLRQLAEDELRYGLPVHEARQALNEIGRLSLPGQQVERTAALARAENLYRQIQAENPSEIGRVQEAQQAMDQLYVVRRALANAMRASLLSHLQGVRIMLWEHVMMEGECPDRAGAKTLFEQARADVRLDDVSHEGAIGRRYRVSGPEGAGEVELICSMDGVEIGHSTTKRPSPPGARP